MAEPVSLVEVLQEIPDPHDSQGLWHPLPSLLSLTVLAVLAGTRGPKSVAQFVVVTGRHWLGACAR